MLQVCDKCQSVEHEVITSDRVIHVDAEETPVTIATNIEEDRTGIVLPKEPEGGNVTVYNLTVSSEAIEDITSDEGWQEASSKVRSANSVTRKIGRRRPNLAKLNTSSSSEYSNFKESNYGREAFFLGQKATPKTSSIVLSPLKHSKSHSLSAREDSTRSQAKIPASRFSQTSVSNVSPTASLAAMASKSVSYKEVAVAPPGTVIKPLLEKVEANVESDTHTSNASPQTWKECENKTVAEEEAMPDNEDMKDAKEGGTESENMKDAKESGTESENSASELEGIPCSSNGEKPIETNGTKLSAAAQPFNPGPCHLAHRLNSVAVTSVYDVIASQGMLAEPVEFPPVAAGVPCGPRSPLYYKATHSFQMKHGLLKPVKERSGISSPKIMNPNAPEFVPRRAWQINPASVDSKHSTDPNSLEIGRAHV